MKRLGGWDAVLLYNETANLHQHTMKIAIVDGRTALTSDTTASVRPLRDGCICSNRCAIS